MINKLELPHLPFVDGCPEADQKRIPWVRNGECLTAASTKYGNDGVLNGHTLGVQKNVEALEKNSTTSKDKLNEVITEVNNISEALSISNDTSVIKQIAENKDHIEILQVHMQFAENNIGGLETDTAFLKEDLGVFDPEEDSLYRPVRQDLLWIKTEMGQYPDQDINGIFKQGAVASGMKRRIIDNSTAIVNTIKRVTKLENDYSESDVGSLSIKLNEIRDELGPKTSATGTTVYSRVSTLESGQQKNKDDIARISTDIGLGTGLPIVTRVKNVEDKTVSIDDTLNRPITGVIPRVTTIETAIGTKDVPASINGRLDGLRTDVNALGQIVGLDTSSGLRGQVAWMSQTIGSDLNPEESSIQGRLGIVETRSARSASDIQDLQAEIGNNNAGLKGSVLQLTSQMEGTNPNGTTVEERGVIRSITQLEQKNNSKIDDAPSDGQAYVRKDGAWVLLSTLIP